MDTSNSVIVSKADDLQLTALFPHEMLSSQVQLIEWVTRKLVILQANADELQESYLHAKSCKWKHTAIQSAHSREVKRIEFYEKMKSALEHGYCIVPNFPITLFAIRTNRKRVEQGFTTNWSNRHEQDAQQLPMDEGDYKNPFPIVHKREITPGTETKNQYFAKDWDDFECPINMAKPVIMKATTQAMALRVFDQIGIMPEAKKEDPVIIGQIFIKNGWYSRKTVSFMIAWHLNTNVL